MPGTLFSSSQQHAMDAFHRFLAIDRPRSTFVLRGAAGTGKSHLALQMVRAVQEAGRPALLLAPTGRAARVLRDRTGMDAMTIHRAIYNLAAVQEIMIDEGGIAGYPCFVFALRAEREPVNAVFIVDECSMIGDRLNEDPALRFGSGRLLSDLVDFIFAGAAGCGRPRLVLIGDHVQLPPVGENDSPALDSAYLTEAHRLQVTSVTLRENFRQQTGGGIADMADRLRAQIESGNTGRLVWESGDQIVPEQSPDAAFARYMQAAASGSPPHIICFRNADASAWNGRIRRALHGAVDPLTAGDSLVIERNHAASGLLNGDMVRVVSTGTRRVRRLRETTLTYIEATLAWESGEGAQAWSGLLLETLLGKPGRTLTPEEEQARWVHLKMDHPAFKVRSAEFAVAAAADPFWNAVMARYGHATTCHKAQGGEWDDVLLMCTAADSAALQSTFGLRWLYTAVTRARRRLIMLNPPTWDGAESLRRGAAGYLESRMSAAAECREETIERAIEEACAACGCTVDRFSRLQYRVRSRVTSRTGALEIDVSYRADGEVSGVVARTIGGDAAGGAAATPPFTSAELNARILTRHSPAPICGVPDSVQNLLDRVEDAAGRQGLTIRCGAEQYAVSIRASITGEPASGVARVTIHYDGRGRLKAPHVHTGSPPEIVRRVMAILAAV